MGTARRREAARMKVSVELPVAAPEAESESDFDALADEPPRDVSS